MVYKIKINLQLFKGGSTTVTNTSSYTPSPEERQLIGTQAAFAQKLLPNAEWLNDTARKILEDSIGAVQVDFNQMNNAAQNQINQAQQANQQLASGVLPQSVMDNITQNVQSAAQNSMGNMLNGLANRGILNSSVTNTGMNDLSKNVTDTISQQQQSYMNMLNNMNNSNIQNATAGITTGAAAQEAAQTPAINLWNSSIGLGNVGNGTLGALAGKGTTTTSQTTSGGGGLFGGLLGGLF